MTFQRFNSSTGTMMMVQLLFELVRRDARFFQTRRRWLSD
jgi:hypothetical protein